MGRKSKFNGHIVIKTTVMGIIIIIIVIIIAIMGIMKPSSFPVVVLVYPSPVALKFRIIS